MIPIRIPEFLYKLKHNLFPDYFLYALLAAGCEILEPHIIDRKKRSDIKYANMAMDILEKICDIHDPYIIWACCLIDSYIWKIIENDKRQVIYGTT
ncbi:hypothetical protein AYI69_g7697 [Smittium culicis]|uniref:Uncharacterized protein n=1 Tax=Smittium culicis TaxID=133412 RepID=A0A1R1XQ41_9FUNG|nr:hypothetical protein AYI69_g7697 [Smittium culicis]